MSGRTAGCESRWVCLTTTILSQGYSRTYHPGRARAEAHSHMASQLRCVKHAANLTSFVVADAAIQTARGAVKAGAREAGRHDPFMMPGKGICDVDIKLWSHGHN